MTAHPYLTYPCDGEGLPMRWAKLAHVMGKAFSISPRHGLVSPIFPSCLTHEMGTFSESPCGVWGIASYLKPLARVSKPFEPKGERGER